MLGRRVGLSKERRPPPLLNTVYNMPRTKSRKAPAVDDLPMSTDDEADSETVAGSPHTISGPGQGSPDSHGSGPRRSNHSLLGDADSSDERTRTRVDISQTNFSKGAPSCKLQGSARRSRKTVASLMSAGKGSEDEELPSVKRARHSNSSSSTYGRAKGNSTVPASSGDYLKDERGFIKSKRANTKYTPRVRVQSEQQAESKSTATKQRAKKAPLRTKGSEPSVLIAIPDSLGSPKKSKELKLKRPKPVPDSRESSPCFPVPGGKRAKGSSGRLRALSPTPDPPYLKIPAPFSDFVCGSGGKGVVSETILSDAVSETGNSKGSSSDLEVTGCHEAVETAAVCPWCDQPVDKSFLDEFSKGKRMNVRLQTRFCRQHKKRTAMETWQARRYPEVSWERLEVRFTSHRSFLLGIVNGNSSHYRSILARKIQSGQARSMKKDDDLNPGYYGPRGFDLMCDYLVDEFGDLLKEKAVNDRVIAGRGSAAFIQTVLVAELAVQLIKDDMGVSTDEARTIMEESKVLGEMVHEGS